MGGAAACTRAGRDVADVQVIAVSKTFGPDRVAEAVERCPLHGTRRWGLGLQVSGEGVSGRARAVRSGGKGGGPTVADPFPFFFPFLLCISLNYCLWLFFFNVVVVPLCARV